MLLCLQVLAVADAAGVLHVVDVPRTLRRRGHGEVKAMAALMEREQARLAYLQERQAVRTKLQKVGLRGCQQALLKGSPESPPHSCSWVVL